MSSLHADVLKAAEHVRASTDTRPEVAIVLGTGLGRLANEITSRTVIPYDEIPGFVTSTVETHDGKLIIGNLASSPVVAMQGRFHFYEGYSMRDITFPVRVMRELGANILVISNAAGGMNPDFEKGDLVLITDHINLLGDNPLIGLSEPELGPRFPDMGRAYSKRLRDLAHTTAGALDISLREGVYVAVAGPSLETPAEYRFLRLIGADMVGMSTVPETIVGIQIGMEVLGVTIVSDLCDPDNLAPVDISEIIAACNAAEPSLTKLIRECVSQL